MSFRFRCLGLFPVFFIILLLAQSILAAPKESQIRGTIGAATSPTQFEVGSDTVVCGTDTTMVLKYGDKKLTLPFQPEVIRSGVKVEVAGTRDSDTRQLQAKVVTVAMFEVTKTSNETAAFSISGIALIEKSPEVSKAGKGWAGTVFADGRKLRVLPTTKIQFIPNESERAAKGKSSSTLKSLEDVAPGVFVSYEALPLGKGVVLAEKMSFVRNETQESKTKWQGYEPTLTEPDYAAKTPGKIALKSKFVTGEFPVIPSKFLQERINQVGLSLVPSFQRSMADGDPLKPQIRFYVIESDRFAVKTLPNGIVLVTGDLLRRLENEAQLAAVLGAEISLVSQERLYSESQQKMLASPGAELASAYFFFGGIGLAAEAIHLASGGARCDRAVIVGAQAGRLALDYTRDAGYDPREGERVFSSLAQKSQSGGSPDSGERCYYKSMASETQLQLKEAYGDVSFSGLKVGAEEYKEVLAELQTVRPTPPK